MDWYAELKRRFAEQRDPENAVKMAAYMRNLFAFYGLATPKRRALYRDMLREAKFGCGGLPLTTSWGARSRRTGSFWRR